MKKVVIEVDDDADTNKILQILDKSKVAYGFKVIWVFDIEDKIGTLYALIRQVRDANTQIEDCLDALVASDKR